MRITVTSTRGYRPAQAATHLIADVVASTSGTPASLAGVSLDTSPVKPFDRIDIDGLNLAADLSDFGVVIDTADGEGDLPVLVGLNGLNERAFREFGGGL